MLAIKDVETQTQSEKIFKNYGVFRGDRSSGQIELGLNDGRVIVLSKELEVVSECITDSAAEETYGTKNKRASVVIGFDANGAIVGGVNSEGKC